MNNFYRISKFDIEQSINNLQQLTFEVTGFCNLKCTYCCYGEFYEGFDSNRFNLSFCKARNVIDYLYNVWNDKKNIKSDDDFYISFYGGEPLLNVELIKKIILYANGKIGSYRKVKYSMTTNAVILDKYIDFVIENDILLLISLDGDRLGNSYRIDCNGNSQYDRIYSCIKRIKDENPYYFSRKIEFNTVLHTKNSVTGINAYFKKEFSKQTMITELSQDDLKDSCKNIFYEKMYKSYVGNEENLINDLENKKISGFMRRFTGNFYDSYNTFLYSKNDCFIFQTSTCIPFSKKIFVTASGKILPCERISQNYNLGEVTDDKVELDFENVAYIYNKLLDSVSHMCMECYNKYTCDKCIYKLINFYAENGYCDSFMDEDIFAINSKQFVSKLRDNPELYCKLKKELS